MINKEKSIVSLVILPNDNPYGTVEFNQDSIKVIEEEDNAVIPLHVDRIDGYFGDILVYYRYLFKVAFATLSLSLSISYFISENRNRSRQKTHQYIPK